MGKKLQQTIATFKIIFENISISIFLISHFFYFSVSIVRQKQYTGVVGILHTVLLNANKTTGIKSINEHVEGKDDCRICPLIRILKFLIKLFANVFASF